jgi:hypothetical protein
MAYESRDLQVKITGDASNFSKSIDDATNSSNRAGLSFTKMSLAVAAGQAIFSVAEKTLGVFTGFLGKSIQAAMTEQDAMAQINNELRNFGDLAPITSQQANDIAESMARTSINSKDMVLQAEQIILKFDRITKDTFPQTLQVTEDLSARLGITMPDAANKLGKALEDPRKAMRALIDAGISFTKAQKDVLIAASNTGDVMVADNMILDALSQNLQGASVAAASTFSGKMQILNNDFQMFQEKIGSAILNALSPFIDKIMKWAQTDQAQQVIRGITTWVGTMAEKMARWVTDVAIPWIVTYWPQIKKGIKDTWDTLVFFVKAIGEFAGWVVANKNWLVPVISALALVKAALMLSDAFAVAQGLFTYFTLVTVPAADLAFTTFAATLAMPLTVAAIGVGAIIAVYNAAQQALGALDSLRTAMDNDEKVTEQIGAAAQKAKASGDMVTYKKLQKIYTQGLASNSAIEKSASNINFFTGLGTGLKMLTSGAVGWASGGFTGRGLADEVAGIVHKGEYVLPPEAVNQTTGQPKVGNAPNVTLNVNVGMYAGMPVEKREIALSMYKELVRAARAQGVNMPMIGAGSVQ